MPLPKRRFSKSRTRKKRAAKVYLATPNLGICPQCKQPKPAHRVCAFCGYYDGRQIVKIKTKEKKKRT